MSMYYGALPNIFEKARWLRNNQTKEEKILWKQLIANKVLSLRFKSQHPIDVYIADFYCHKIRLAIEVDGETHLEKGQEEYDTGRTHELDKLGIEGLRFSNHEILNAVDCVVKEVTLKCQYYLSKQMISPL